MAKLLAYTVTSNISKQEILEEVLRRLKMAEELNNGEDAFSLTYDYNTKTNRFYYRCPKCGDVTTTVFKHSERN